MKEFEKYKNYAIWYYLRYFPSINKLTQKLSQKTQNQELTTKILNDIKHIFNEKTILTDKIHICLIRNKNYNYILTSLLKKGFEKEMIQDLLINKFDCENKSLLNEFSIKNKIQNYKNKNKSISYIKQKLIQRPQDKDIIENIISEIFTNWENDLIINEYEKIKNKYEKNKIIQKLLAKWFLYSDIKKIIN